MRKASVSVFLATIVGLLGLGAAPASAAAAHYVNDDAAVGANTSCASPGYNTIQAAVDAATAGDTINVCDGTYEEDVAANKTLSLLGAGIDSSVIVGQTGGASSSGIHVSAADVLISGFTVTREGNNTTDWNDGGLNSAGVSIQGQTASMELRNSMMTGNRTGVDVNNSNGSSIHNNVIDFNRTGMILRNQTDDMTVEENEITDNWTGGVVFLDASTGSNVPVQSALSSEFFNNNISGNWYGQVVERQSGGSLPAPGTTNLKAFSGNWWGTATPVVTTANSTEPGYDVQIPVEFGGTATPPGGQPDIAGPASANMDYTPALELGADTNGAKTGFQGDFSSLRVHDGGAQVGATGRIQEGAELADGSTVNVEPGTYNEAVNLPAGSDDLTVAGTDPDARPLLTDGVLFGAGMTDLTLQDLRITNDGGNVAGGGSVTGLEMDNVEIDGADVPGQFGVAGTQIHGAVDVHDSEFVNIRNWAVFDTRSGSGGATSGSLLTTFNFSDNELSDNGGHVNARGTIGTGNTTSSVTISGNTVEDYPDAPTNNAAAVFKVFYADTTSFTDNAITNIGSLQTSIGGFPYGAGLMPRNAGDLTVTGNTFDEAVQGVAFEPRNTTSGGFDDGVIAGGTITDNTFTDNSQGVFVTATNHPSSALGDLEIGRNHFETNTQAIDNDSATTLNAECNWWGASTGPAAGDVTGPATSDPFLVSSDLAGACSSAPTLASNAGTVTVTEGQTATNGGTYEAGDAEEVELTASVGTVTKTGTNSGTWSWSLTPTTPGTQTVTITGDNGEIGITSFTLTVNEQAVAGETVAGEVVEKKKKCKDIKNKKKRKRCKRRKKQDKAPGSPMMGGAEMGYLPTD